jgi:hypothetical protein
MRAAGSSRLPLRNKQLIAAKRSWARILLMMIGLVALCLGFYQAWRAAALRKMLVSGLHLVDSELGFHHPGSTIVPASHAAGADAHAPAAHSNTSPTTKQSGQSDSTAGIDWVTEEQGRRTAQALVGEGSIPDVPNAPHL